MVAAALVLRARLRQPHRPNRPLRRKQKEFVLGLTMPGPTSLGDTTAELLNGSGNPSVTLLRTKNSLGWGFGSRPVWAGS